MASAIMAGLALLLIAAPAVPARAQGALTSVPDVVARQSQLRVRPMPRAAQTYATNCQGCHGDLGRSASEIPRLAGRVGYFARVPAGRRYLVQVPNVALNPSSDVEIADVLNWVLRTYSRAQLPADFQPYTAEEVSVLRQERIDVAAVRARVVAELVAKKQIPSADALALPAIVPY